MLRFAHEERIVNGLKAIIMAGGEGSRLRPLTCDCPKPMLRLMGKPLMEYAVRLLQKYGINEIGATLGYLPDAIMDYFGDGEAFGTHLHYYIEKSPLGTAGSVKRAQDFLDERFIVLSGDGITDFDLSRALRFHAQKGAAATLLLKKSAHPQEYGMVVADDDSRILSFHEKPGRSDVYSDLINTGIYILEPEILRRIPEGQPYDFGHDLFPALVAAGAPVYGYIAPGYWCDVGDVAAYLRVHADALRGMISIDGLQPCTSGAILDPGCTIEAPVFIAPGAHICAGSRIGPYSVIGENCFVAPGADIKRSLLFSSARIEPNAQLRGSIVGTNAIIGEGAQLYEESAVGSNSRVGERAVLLPGVKLWPEKAIPCGEKPEANIVWGSRREMRFIGGALEVENPAQATRAAEACVAHMKPRELVLGRSASCVADALQHAVIAGAMAQGIQIIDAGVCTLPQLRYVLRLLHADAAMLVEADSIIPLNAQGATFTERSQRDILKLMERQDFAGPFATITHPLAHTGDISALYAADTASAFLAAHAPKLLLCADGLVLETAEQVCRRVGLQVETEYALDNMHPVGDEIGIYLPDSGETALLADEQGMMTEGQRQLACAWTALEMGEKKLFLPAHATQSIEELARRYDAEILYLYKESSLWMDSLAKESTLQFRLQLDGLYFALAFLSLLSDRRLSLNHWRRMMPEVCRSTHGIPVPSGESGRVLHQIAREAKNARMGGGVRLMRENGWAWLGLDEKGAQLNIIAEAMDMETSREICDFYENEILRLLAGRD